MGRDLPEITNSPFQRFNQRQTPQQDSWSGLRYFPSLSFRWICPLGYSRTPQTSLTRLTSFFSLCPDGSLCLEGPSRLRSNVSPSCKPPHSLRQNLSLLCICIIAFLALGFKLQPFVRVSFLRASTVGILSGESLKPSKTSSTISAQ